MNIKLPKHIADELANLTEHGMGYQNVRVILQNGVKFDTQVLNSENLVIPNAALQFNVTIDKIESIEYLN
jgi:hypothetical protein